MPTDMQALERLEAALERKIRCVPLEGMIERRERGCYAVDDEQRIVGLDLSPYYLQTIYESLVAFPHLQVLGLASNPLPDYSFLQDLKQLTSLDLSFNQITDISFLQDLKQLTSLNLSSNQITDYSFLQDLKQLTSLNLSSNQITDISFLQDLKQLTSLNLSSNQITDYSFLQDLKQLTSLNLSSNQITDYSFLQDLKQLTSLDLSFNQIADISFLQDLKQLTSLDLSFNQITNISFLQDLKQLTSLDLYNNQITDISFLQDLKQLTSLDLSGNQITDISFLQNLKQLTSLDLYNNQITNISFLQDLKQLTSLNLSGNQITDISFLQDLKQLTSLDLYNNQITDLPEGFFDLKYLYHLDLHNNKIQHLPTPPVGMPVKWESYQDGVCVEDNPLEYPPADIVRQGPKAVRDYYKSVASGETVELNEVKVILVGEGMSGKTSLLKQLQGLDFDQDESQTHGVNVVSLPIERLTPSVDVSEIEGATLHCWDFGGQEIMHASHRFFLSERSVYILVLDSRTDNKKYHWLKHIEKYGGDSPVIVAMNKIDDNPNYNIEQRSLNTSFPHIRNRFHRISCKTGTGLDTLVQNLVAAIPQTSLFGAPISVDWMHIKNELVDATAAQRYINRAQFLDICERHRVVDASSQMTLLRYLHDLGIVLHFDRLSLADIYVLDPHWVTIGVYRVINSEKIVNGILREAGLDYILNREDIKTDEYDPAQDKQFRYAVEEQRYIVSIMMQFELCYEYNRERGEYIIPDLLPSELDHEPELTAGNAISFVMAYDYLPSSIISRLMLRYKNDILDRQQWKYGMVLRDQQSDCRAKIKADEYLKEIAITIEGELHRKRDYFSAIRRDIWDINGEFENLNIREFIPLPDHPEIHVDYAELIGYEQAGKDEYFVGRLGKPYSVSAMLDSIITQAERSKEHIVVVNNNLENIGNPQQTVNQTQHAELKASQEQTVTQEVKQVQEVQGLFKNLKEDILDEIDIEIDDDKEKRKPPSMN